MPKLRHFDHLNTARFITFCCYRRHQFLLHTGVCEVLIKLLGRTLNNLGIRLYGYVFMPEHVHLVLHPPDTIRLGRGGPPFRWVSS